MQFILQSTLRFRIVAYKDRNNMFASIWTREQQDYLAIFHTDYLAIFHRTARQPRDLLFQCYSNFKYIVYWQRTSCHSTYQLCISNWKNRQKQVLFNKKQLYHKQSQKCFYFNPLMQGMGLLLFY